jgi:MerR family transcriptional regulator, aldehyde-responsive regulator
MTIREVSEKFGISQDTLRYYERIGLIPPVTRTAGGVRNYQPDDLKWVEHTVCMRSAGVSVEALIEYLRLYQQGDETFEARLQLLTEQLENLEQQKQQMEVTIARLNYKISRYKTAVETGVLDWSKPEDKKE